jgi:hypothetical protein
MVALTSVLLVIMCSDGIFVTLTFRKAFIEQNYKTAFSPTRGFSFESFLFSSNLYKPRRMCRSATKSDNMQPRKSLFPKIKSLWLSLRRFLSIHTRSDDASGYHTQNISPLRVGLATLPPELILCITGHLTAADDVLALALTCRGLSVMLLARTLPFMEISSQEKLLLRLERDLGATHYFCTYCFQLHGTASLSPPGQQIAFRRWLDNTCLRMDFCPLLSGFRFGYYQARLIMNRHFYGPDCGLPLESLDLVIPHVGRRGWTSIYTGKIINDELILFVTHKFVPQTSTVEALHKLASSRPYWICRHDDVPIPKQREQTYSQKGFCDRCLTDYRIQVQQEDTGQFSMVVYSYHLAGSVRHHMDWKWQALTRWTRSGYWPKRRDEKQYPPGYVSNMWLEDVPFSR